MLLKKTLFGSLLVLGLILVAESLSFLGLWLLEGRPLAASRLQQRRAEVLQGSTEVSASGEARRELDPTGAAREVLHPFLGYVLDPASNELQKRRERGENEINRWGFYRPPGPPKPREKEEFRIGIFGGSVAFLFALSAQETLIEALAEETSLNPEAIVVDSFGLGGYKQPQQLLTLTYLLAMGETFDVVVNLDGFNEVALTLAENLPADIHYSYPRGWSSRVAGLPDPEQQALGAAVYQLKEQRRNLASRFSHSVFRQSMLANLIWRHRDRELQARIGILQSDLLALAATTGADSYLRHGPANPKTSDSTRTTVLRATTHLWKQSSLQMHALCKTSGCLYLHFLQPNQYVPDSKPMGDRELRQSFQEGHPYQEAVLKGYPLLAEAGEKLRSEGVRFHDLRFLFRDYGHQLYFDTCCHFNEEGNSILAAEVAKQIISGLEQH